MEEGLTQGATELVIAASWAVAAVVIFFGVCLLHLYKRRHQSGQTAAESVPSVSS